MGKGMLILLLHSLLSTQSDLQTTPVAEQQTKSITSVQQRQQQQQLQQPGLQKPVTGDSRPVFSPHMLLSHAQPSPSDVRKVQPDVHGEIGNGLSSLQDRWNFGDIPQPT